jgi:hypothetical protein
VRSYERAKIADERDLVEQLQLYDRTLRHEDDLGGVKKRLVTLILTRFFIRFSATSLLRLFQELLRMILLQRLCGRS